MNEETGSRGLVLRRLLIVCVMLALAIGLYVRAELSDEFLGNAFEGVIIYVIAFAFAVGLWGGDDSAVPREFRHLPVGVGTLRVVKPTGTVINDRPEYDLTFDVATVFGGRFTGTQRVVLPADVGSALRVGVQLPVHHRLDGNTKVAIALDSDEELVEVARMWVQVAQGTLSPEQANAAQYGLRTTARVVEFEPTGELRGDAAVVRVTLQVRRPDGSTFTNVTEKAVSAEELPLLRLGSTVQARYLPDREDLVVVALVVPQGGA